MRAFCRANTTFTHTQKLISSNRCIFMSNIALDGTTGAVDLRSDTVTKPTSGMIAAMSTAAANSVGDDVFQEDISVTRLQDRLAERLNFEAGLFFPTATMANLAAVGAHTAGSRLNEVILGETSHIVIYECGGISAYMGCAIRTVPNRADGGMEISHLSNALRHPTDIHQPRTRLVCTELTHNKSGGRSYSAENGAAVTSWAHENDIPVHVDGSRLLNGAASRGVDPVQMVEGTSSMTLCLSKGVGCPMGAVLFGDKAFIETARHLRKSLGGGMRQVGVMAAAGMWALEEQQGLWSDPSGDAFLAGLRRDHAHASMLAKGINAIEGLVVAHEVESNMVFFDCDERLGLSAPAIQAYCRQRGVLIGAYGPARNRVVTHLNVTREECVRTLEVLQQAVTVLFGECRAALSGQ